MARAIWKGEISFGLVSIPVTLQSAEEPQHDIRLHLLDKHDFAPIGYERINKLTKKKVDREDIVEGYEYKPGSYAVLTESEIENLQKKATHSINILAFVEQDDIDPLLFSKPYYLLPDKRGIRAYALLLQTLKTTGKVGITKVVIHTHEYLAFVTVRENLLVLELMRFANELRKPEEYGLSHQDIKKIGIHEKEITMAKQLVSSMTEKWKPEKFKNDYREQFLNYIKKKVRQGKTTLIKEEREEKESTPRRKADVVDLMSLLKKSIPKEAANKKTFSKRKKAHR